MSSNGARGIAPSQNNLVSGKAGNSNCWLIVASWRTFTGTAEREGLVHHFCLG